ncbi:carbamoyltransferase C-terminal domain-containing protein [Micromonospora echinaurantiaca]|uniref:carbamoyltransferase C-terminal domain-containing protein n=1 Tax=Micromonospora echinaurantiaca TaxID=47857 RepID=UPI00378866B7
MTGTAVICGLKLTHDGAVAVITDGRLLFSTEAEKIANSPRHCGLTDAGQILDELRASGVDPAEVTHVAVDGWTPRVDGSSYVELRGRDGRTHPLAVAGYSDEPGGPAGPVRPVHGDGLPLHPMPGGFASYTHSAGHLFASYCTSPFAERDRPALVVVWDGGMPPFLYRYDPRGGALRRVGWVGPASGGLYPIFASHFPPFRVDRRSPDRDRMFGMEALFPVSGKAMAYAALGKPDEDAIAVMERVTADLPPADTHLRMYGWTREVLRRLDGSGLPDATVISSFQEYLFRVLLAGVRAALRDAPELAGLPLCLSGGCHLNITWNAGLRASGLFEEVWVPPFPNDAGSAIGAACAEMVRVTGRSAVRWSAFAGPGIRWDGVVPAGWSARPCDVAGLAELLHRENEPVVVVSGRAELGPRALGHRSIIAPAVSAGMRDTLNRLKHREGYRPVAPICLAEHAAEVFAPGTRDPYMLFAHDVRPEWVDRVPAIVHVDGSARLQTVDASNSPTYELLRAYHRLSGVPVLCNTSANHPGKGFFPDPGSAMAWGQTRYVWSEGILYTRGDN